MPDEDLSGEEVEKIASDILRDSVKSGDYDSIREIDGECIVCSEDAMWQSPSGTYYCEEHATEYFRERRG